MTNTVTKKLAIALLTMVMLVSLMVGGTYAYFTDSVSIDGNIITAGDIEVTAQLYEEGNATAIPKIELDNFAPGDSKTYKLEVTNTGSLDADYKVVLTATDDALLDALTITYDGATMNIVDGVFQTDWEKVEATEPDTAVELPIVITFNAGAGNAYENTQFAFDIDVLATQAGKGGNAVLANTVADIEGATAGNTVMFMQDINGSVTLDKAVNFDFNGHKLLGNLTITDNTAKTMDIGDRYTGTAPNPEYVTGDVTIEALQATVYLNVAVNGERKVNAATDGNSFHFNGGFVTLKADNTLADTQDQVGEVVVKAGRAVINKPANVVVEKKPTVGEVADSVITQEEQIKDVEVVVGDNVNVPKLEIGTEVEEEIKLENKGTVNTLDNKSSVTVTVDNGDKGTVDNVQGTVEGLYDGMFASGDGTENNPFVIDSAEQFATFASNTSGCAVGGYYWTVTVDIDTSGMTVYSNYYGSSIIKKFVGNMDFDGNKLYSNEGAAFMIYDFADSTLQNIDYVVSSETGLIACVKAGANVLANIDAYGTMSTSSNNTNPYVLYYLPDNANASLLYKDCTNYANITNTSTGCSGIFLGSGGGSLSTAKLEFDSCVNHGTLLASTASAAMLINNISIIGNGLNYLNITITDCVNYGTIFGNKEQPNLAIGRSSGFGLTNTDIYDTLNDPDKIWNAEGGQCAKNADAFGTLDILDGNFVLPTTEGAVRYELTFSFWDFMYTDAEKTNVHGWGSVGKTIDLTSLDGVVLPAYSWRTEYPTDLGTVTVGDATLYTFDSEGITYYAFKGISDDNYYHTLRTSKLPNKVVLTAFDADGNVLSMSQYIYAD